MDINSYKKHQKILVAVDCIIFGFDGNSTWDQLGEVPIVSTVTSAVRFTKGILSGLWHVIHLNREALKQDQRDVVRAIWEVVPIVKVNDKPIGDGKPGPVVGKLHKAFREIIEEHAKLTV